MIPSPQGFGNGFIRLGHNLRRPALLLHVSLDARFFYVLELPSDKTLAAAQRAPVEILLEIAEHLSQSDISRAMMTCHLWGTALRPALFRCLRPGSFSGETGTGNGDHAKAQLLLRTLRSSPTLAGLARELNLEAANAADHRVTIIEPLELCQNLLTIRFRDLRRPAVKEAIPAEDEVLQAVLQAVTRPQTRQAVITGWAVSSITLLQAFCSCNNLVSLFIAVPEWTDPIHVGDSFHVSLPSLKRLVLSIRHFADELALRIIRQCPLLDEITISVRRLTDPHALMDVLTVHQPELRRLYLFLNGEGVWKYRFFMDQYVSRFASLTHLHCSLLTYGGALFDGRLPRSVRSLAVEAVDAAGIDQRGEDPTRKFSYGKAAEFILQCKKEGRSLGQFFITGVPEGEEGCSELRKICELADVELRFTNVLSLNNLCHSLPSFH